MYGTDMRQHVSTTHEYPYSAIGMLSIKFENKNCLGTGFLVGPNIVLTSAFNCIDILSGTKAKEIFYYPALNGYQGESYQVKKVHYEK